MLIGQSGARELLPQNHLEMTRTGFRKLYFLRRTSHDFENNGKIAHGNELELQEQQKATTHVEASLKIFQKKLYSTSRNKFLG